ncbi:helix-turn-helix transcriptional regulator [Methanofollis fontis]|uniref:Methanogenesis regulatory protein FilR1 middle domain-containing protein n=1 Tax=Methanofollis fontis TaxID=2052832 RepID=A0A483CVL3_9EURY|nr:transcriptional regulator FilR1 domain-containing protein [Methanofollis fontis]TAJ45706.1 hypothetical protein CUJ86_03045 [Methanofollis fontis]
MITVLSVIGAEGVGADDITRKTGFEQERVAEILGGLRYRWLITGTGDLYTLTTGGTLLATRTHDLAVEFYRAISRDRTRKIPHFFRVIGQVRNELIRMGEDGYLEGLDDPVSAEPSIAEWLLGMGLLEVGDGGRQRTPAGEEVLRGLERCIRIAGVIEEFNAFFEFHSLEGVPEFALESIEDLINAELICDVPVNFEQRLEFYLDIIREAEWLHGVSTWSKPAVAATLWDLVIAGKEVELVITPELAAALWQEEVVKKGRDPSLFPNLRFFVSTIPISVGLTVTDTALSFGLFLRDNQTYDSIHDLVCRTPEAVHWGERLYQHYRAHSVPIMEFFQGGCG